MEATNEERREVAARLRGLDEATSTLSPEYSRQEYDAMVLRAIRAVVGEGDIFHLLADLIDRPTCETIEHGQPYESHVCKSCSRCSYGWFEDIHDKPYSYCPNCGAEVVNDD